jgi:hypothetical protein
MPGLHGAILVDGGPLGCHRVCVTSPSPPPKVDPRLPPDRPCRRRRGACLACLANRNRWPVRGQPRPGYIWGVGDVLSSSPTLCPVSFRPRTFRRRSTESEYRRRGHTGLPTAARLIRPVLSDTKGADCLNVHQLSAITGLRRRVG